MQSSKEAVPEELISQNLAEYSTPDPAQLAAALEYLVRMGCLRRNAGEFAVAPLLFDMLHSA